jgi:archaetidylinositol phosphate synthase
MPNDASGLILSDVSVEMAARSSKAANANGFKDATRVQESFAAPLERRVLAWLAVRLPAWVNSDHLTLLGFAAMFLAGASYAFARVDRAGFLLASVFLAVNWFGDSLDGTLARMRNRQRSRYGFYVDHIIDTFGALFLMGGLAISGYIHWEIALGMLIAFLMLSIEAYLATYTLGKFRLSYGKFGPTEIRILLVLGNTALWFNPAVRAFGSEYRLLDVGGLIGIAGMGVILIASAIAHTVELYRQETFR